MSCYVGKNEIERLFAFALQKRGSFSRLLFSSELEFSEDIRFASVGWGFMDGLARRCSSGRYFEGAGWGGDGGCRSSKGV